jgi:hypothetical protein
LRQAHRFIVTSRDVRTCSDMSRILFSAIPHSEMELLTPQNRHLVLVVPHDPGTYARRIVSMVVLQISTLYEAAWASNASFRKQGLTSPHRPVGATKRQTTVVKLA